jgi:hypothetical protein
MDELIVITWVLGGCLVVLLFAVVLLGGELGGQADAAEDARLEIPALDAWRDRP